MRDVLSAFSSQTREAKAAYDHCARAVVRVAMALWIGATMMPLATAAAQAPWRTRPDSGGRDTTQIVADSAARRVNVDSLAARLERTEAALELLKQQVATETGTSVRTRSRLQSDIWARVLMNGFMSRGQLNSADVPTYATNDVIPNGKLERRAVGFSLRQT